MDTIILGARLVLAATFLISSVAKMADKTAFRRALVDFGLPPRAAEPLHLALPIAEIAIALALLGATSSWAAALAALVLLVLFTTAIAINLAKGRTPACHCFGELGDGAVSRRTLMRNALLAILAGLILWRGPMQGGPGILEGLQVLSALQFGIVLPLVVTVILFAIQGWFIVHLLRQNGRLLLRVEALEASSQAMALPAAYPLQPSGQNGLLPGTEAPAFNLPSAIGSGVVSLSTLLEHGKPVILIFIDPDCGPCTHLRPKIERWQQIHARRLTFAVISRVGKNENGSLGQWEGMQHLLLQESDNISDVYHVHGTPSAIFLTADGTIAAPLVAGADAIQGLVQRAVQQVILPSSLTRTTATRV